jgi:CRISPR/Cas system-associated exonuclease Cas4 (RecB family)
MHYYHQIFLPSLSTNEMTIGLEQRLLTPLPVRQDETKSALKGEDNNGTFSITIDRLAKRGDTFIIYDYKTNKRLTEEEQQLHREQLYLYAWVVQENYGNYFSHLELCLLYLALDRTERWTVDEAELQTVLEKYSSLAAEITIKKEELTLTERSDLFSTKKSEICKWCTFREICPAFAESSAFSSS